MLKSHTGPGHPLAVDLSIRLPGFHQLSPCSESCFRHEASQLPRNSSPHWDASIVDGGFKLIDGALSNSYWFDILSSSSVATTSCHSQFLFLCLPSASSKWPSQTDSLMTNQPNPRTSLLRNSCSSMAAMWMPQPRRPFLCTIL